MTLAELNRAIASKDRAVRREAQEKACYDYILAQLIGKSVGRIFNSSNEMPALEECYPALFNTEEIEEKKAELKTKESVIRFRNFAAAYNKKFKGRGN